MDGEKSGSKVSPEAAEQEMRKKLPVEDWLPVGSIKSYFSRLAKSKRLGVTPETTDPEIESADLDGEVEEVEGLWQVFFNF